MSERVLCIAVGASGRILCCCRLVFDSHQHMSGVSEAKKRSDSSKKKEVIKLTDLKSVEDIKYYG